MLPDPKLFNPNPDYFRDLIESTGMTQGEVARDVLGCSDRAIRMWLSGDRQYPYTVQFTLESHVLGVL